MSIIDKVRTVKEAFIPPKGVPQNLAAIKPTYKREVPTPEKAKKPGIVQKYRTVANRTGAENIQAAFGRQYTDAQAARAHLKQQQERQAVDRKQYLFHKKIR